MRKAGITDMEISSIRYLEQGEKQAGRALYEAAFPEDSKEFIDYYYKWKTKDNEVIVMEGAGSDRAFHVMIHLNPYVLNINGNIREVPYIVAVATDVRYRRQGKMGQVMGRALQDMGHRQIPFTFLLPADPAYYRGQGFVFFPCQDYLQRGGICFGADAGKDLLRAASLAEPGGDTLRAASLAEPGGDMFGVGWKRAAEEDFGEMASFSNRILADRCEIFIRRDKNYYRRLAEELASERGGVLLLKEPVSGHRGELFLKKPVSGHGGAPAQEPGICGILLYSVSGIEEKTAEIKELLLLDSISREGAERICRHALREAGCAAGKIKFTSSRMMVRLTNLRALVPLLRSERRTILSVKVTDPIIKDNNGCFRIETSRAGGSISGISEESAMQQMDIGELAQTLFQHTSVYLNEWV